MVSSGKSNECKGEMAFERIRNSDHAAFGNGRMRGYGLLN